MTDAGKADLPQGLKRDGLPGRVGPRFDAVESVAGEHRGCPGRPVSAAEVAHHPVARVGDQSSPLGFRDAFPDAAQHLGFGHDEIEFRGRSGPDQVLKHRQPHGRPGPEAGDRIVGPVAEVVAQHGLQVVGPDAPAGHVGPEPLLGQIRLAAEHLAPAADRFVEGQVFEGVQRVVMDEDRDRPLGRKQMGRMVDGVGQSVGTAGPGARVMCTQFQRHPMPLRSEKTVRRLLPKAHAMPGP